MERYKNCHVYVDADAVKRLAQYHYGSIKEMLKKLGYSRQRYNIIVSKPHFSANEQCLIKIAKCLRVDIKNITYKKVN